MKEHESHTRNNKQIMITLTPESIEALRELAAGAGLSLSAMIRTLIATETRRQKRRKQ